jgi:hypothetical protein
MVGCRRRLEERPCSRESFVERGVAHRHFRDGRVAEELCREADRSTVYVLVERAEAIDGFPSDSQRPLNQEVFVKITAITAS